MVSETISHLPAMLRPKRGRFLWALVALWLAALLALPQFVDLAELLNLSLICVFALLALSMSFLWGYVGILSFGQTAFFGLGGYSYAVLALNLGDTTLPFVLAVAIPLLFAGALGYFMIYGRVSDIYLSVVTLVVTLVLEKSIRATSGEQYVIGSVRLNGQNGIPGVPALQVPWDSATTLFIDDFYYLTAMLVVLVYIGLRALLRTQFGRVLVGIRENERRMELLGYDSQRYKLAAFVLCGGLAGLAGVLFAVWGNFVAPEMFGLGQAAQVIIWVIVGGRATLIGPIVGTGLVQYLTTWLGTQGVGQVTLVLGAILLLFVLLFKEGLVPSIARLLTSPGRSRGGSGD